MENLNITNKTITRVAHSDSHGETVTLHLSDSSKLHFEVRQGQLTLTHQEANDSRYIEEIEPVLGPISNYLKHKRGF